jgi:hypothetical protein
MTYCTVIAGTAYAVVVAAGPNKGHAVRVGGKPFLGSYADAEVLALDMATQARDFGADATYKVVEAGAGQVASRRAS